MNQQYYLFRLHRNLRRWRKLTVLGVLRLIHLSRGHIFSRAPRLRWVQRFMLVTAGILLIAGLGLRAQFKELGNYYQTVGARGGGTFVEGTVGKITRINPLFPDEPSADIASKLIFNGLTRYNGQGQVEPDLAKDWQISSDGTEYTVNLRDDVFWHDGHKLSAQDVTYTIGTIQNPEVHSPLASSWQGVTATATAPNTVVFKLASAYSPFVNSLTTAILPQHILGKIAPSQLRVADFSQQPIGTGPFMFEDFLPSQQALRLLANPRYVHGAPKLNRFILRSFENKEDLLSAYQNRQLTAAGGFSILDADQLSGVGKSRLYEWPTASQAYVFFNTDQPILNDVAVRQALTRAIHTHTAAQRLGLRFNTANSPLLPEHLGFNQSLVQLSHDQQAANTLLDNAGWVMGGDGLRHKAEQTLSLELVTQNADVYPTLAQLLQEQWRAIGVELRVQLALPATLQSQYLRPRAYGALLFGIELGGDPDVYSYWHSSQTKDPGLNLSAYKSKEADAALETGRARQDPKIRAAKYETFMRVWRNDAPAIALYRPDFLYEVQAKVRGISVSRLVAPTARFYNVQDWTVNSQQLLKRTQ